MGVRVGDTQRYGPSYDRYYGAVEGTVGRQLLKNGGFTYWPNGWNPAQDGATGPGYWTMEETGDTDPGGGRVETETALYAQMEITVGEPD